MHWSVWITGSIILFVFEMLTPGGFFFACLGAGALITAICCVFSVPFWAQWVIFSIVSLFSIYSLRPIAKRYLQKHEKKSNVDALIGKKAQITEAVNPPALGMIKIEGEIWRAESSENIEKGALVEVVAVEGTRLKVKKQ
jgi:membrane protein implicated in regulation of membrane protease activity